jgi:hypothetical protein
VDTQSISRAEVQDVIGWRAEWLVYLFKTLTRADYLALARNSKAEDSLVKANGNYLIVNANELQDLVTLELANTLEQISRIDFLGNIFQSDHDFFKEVRHLLPPRAQPHLSKLSSLL